MTLTAQEHSTLTSLAERMAFEMSEEQLLREIGLRARTFALFPAAASSAEKSVPEAVALERAWDDLSDFGGWIFRRLHRQLQSVHSGGQFDADRVRLCNALGLTEFTGAGEIVSDLTTRLAVAPAIASVVAALALKRLLKPGWQETYARQPQFAMEAH